MPVCLSIQDRVEELANCRVRFHQVTDIQLHVRSKFLVRARPTRRRHGQCVRKGVVCRASKVARNDSVKRLALNFPVPAIKRMSTQSFTRVVSPVLLGLEVFPEII